MKTSTLEQPDYDALLDWFSPDREKAEKEYTEIRDGIIRFFRFRGVTDPEALADETISRAAAKVSTFGEFQKVKTITYFLGFATNILREYIRKSKKMPLSLDAVQIVSELDEVFKMEGDERIELLKDCLKRLSAEEADLLFEYYSGEKAERIKIRKRLAKQFDWEMTVLHVRVHRLKNRVGRCVKQILKKKL